jgi:glycosyltransferase involved in cell wall biosynthesis
MTVDTGRGTGGPAPSSMCLGSIVIPAHNEASTIERTLRPLAPLALSGELEVIVVCNGCTDATAAIARGYPGVVVMELAEPSKPAALNAGDARASTWPRFYLDADIDISGEAVCAVLEVLRAGSLLAARPSAVYDLQRANPVIRSYYRARNRIPSLQRGLWGAGAYALSETGHRRLGAFPPLAGDDFWVDQLFAEAEKAVLDTPPVIVRVPRDTRTLLSVMARTYGGVSRAIKVDGPAVPSSGRTLRELAGTVRNPHTAADAAVYVAFAVCGRIAARAGNRSSEWRRDDSNR